MILRPGLPDVSFDCGMPQDVTQLACRMAKEYGKLRKFCHMLRSCNSGAERKFSYIAPAEDGECVIHFAEDLRKYGVLILPDRISASAGCPERTICGDIADIPRVISFFNGQWRERFASVEAEKAARERAERLGTDYEVLEGAGIEELATGKTNELDVVIRIGKSLFWIECKCGSFHESAYLKLSAGKTDFCRSGSYDSSGSRSRGPGEGKYYQLFLSVSGMRAGGIRRTSEKNVRQSGSLERTGEESLLIKVKCFLKIILKT